MKNNNYKVLMFATDCYPPVSPEAIVTSKLIIAMENAGWIVHVISVKGARGYPHKEASFWQHVNDITNKIYAPDKKNITNVTQRLLTALKTGHIADGLAWTRKAIIVGEKLIKNEKYDVILSRAYPDFAHHPALYLTKKFNIPWVANWNDPVPLSKFLPPRGQGLDGKIKYYTKRLLNSVAQNADFHTFPCERLRIYMSKYLPFDYQNKCHVIPHVSLKALSFSNITKDKQHFVLCHAGGLNPAKDREPFTFLRGVKIFCDKTRIRNLQIKFIGGAEIQLQAIIKKMGLDDVITLTKYKPYLETLEILASADVVVCIEEKAEEGIYLPSKFVDYTQVNRPILAVSPSNGTLSDMLGMYGGGLAVDCTAPEKIAEALEKLYLSWYNDRISNDYNVVKLQKIFSENTVIKHYEELFAQLTNKTSL